MKKLNKILLTSALCASLGFGIAQTEAADVLITGTLSVSQAVTLSKAADLDFGSVDYAATHSGTMELGPNAVIALTGSPVGLEDSGTPIAGRINITSTSGVIEVTCETGGILSDGTRDLTLQNVKWDRANTVDYATAAQTCAGLGTSAYTADTSQPANQNPSIHIGAELVIGSNALNGSSSATAYNTSTGNGDPVTFLIIYQ